MSDYTAIIIGAGVVGLAIAMELSTRRGMNVLVLERNENFGMEQSSRNSEVIHSGIYYTPGSLKAKLCLKGNQMLYEWCEKTGVPHKLTGKFIVAPTIKDRKHLENLYQNGLKNQVPGLVMHEAEQLHSIVKNIKAVAGIFVPTAGILDTHKLMESYYKRAKEANCDFAFNHTVTAIRKNIDSYTLMVKTGDEKHEVSTKYLINSAGLESDTVAKMLGMDVAALDLELNWCKGVYFKLHPHCNDYFDYLIYPVPEPNASNLGVHLTIDMAGNLKLGPDVEYLSERKQDYSVAESKQGAFYESASKYLKRIYIEDLSPDQAGIRAKLQKNGEAPRDFYIKEESARGLPNFINLIGIESPGLTSSLAIAEYVGEMVG